MKIILAIRKKIRSNRLCLGCVECIPKKRFKKGDKRREKFAMCRKKMILISDRPFGKCLDAKAR